MREEEDRVFVALIPQADPERPGVAACELGLAPENLDEYRTRIDGNAARGGRPGATLVRNEVVKDRRTATGSRRSGSSAPGSGGVWRELSVRIVANRQMYTFILNVDEATYRRRPRPPSTPCSPRPSFARPNTGADRSTRAEPLGPARVQVRPRPARRLVARPRPQRGRPLLRQRPRARHLVRQRPGPGPAPPRRSTCRRLAQTFPDQLRAGRAELRGPLLQGRQARRRPTRSRPSSAPSAGRSR